jgi:HSP20 family protein
MKQRSHTLSVFFYDASKSVGTETCWEPAADVCRTSRGWLLKFDVAGVRLEDISVLKSGSRITVQGVRRDCTGQEVCGYVSMEIAYNRFRRVVELPVELDGYEMTMDRQEGLLLVRVLRNE